MAGSSSGLLLPSAVPQGLPVCAIPAHPVALEKLAWGVEAGGTHCWHERERPGLSGDVQQLGLHPVTGSPCHCCTLPAGAAVPA